jgi:hypothetical protein
MKLTQVLLLMVAVILLVAAVIHMLNAHQSNQVKMAKKMLKMTEHKKLVRGLLAGRNEPL